LHQISLIGKRSFMLGLHLAYTHRRKVFRPAIFGSVTKKQSQNYTKRKVFGFCLLYEIF